MIQSHYNNCKWHKHLLKRNNCPTAYYPNSTTMFNVILELNDIEKNPGPTHIIKAPSFDKSQKVI